MKRACFVPVGHVPSIGNIPKFFANGKIHHPRDAFRKVFENKDLRQILECLNLHNAIKKAS
jgi:hypothetical protein